MPSFEDRLIDALGLRTVDRRVSGWMRRHGHFVLRVALGVVFVWFGLLKPLGVSPAADLIRRTVYFLPPDLFCRSSDGGRWRSGSGFWSAP